MIDLQSTVDGMRKDMAIVKHDMRHILNKLGDEEPIDIREIPIDEIKKLILAERGDGKPFYPSDVAFEHHLDYDAVLEAMDVLRKEGLITE